MEKIKIEREFVYKKNNNDIKLADPSETMTPGDVLNFYSGTYPELINARVEGPVINKDGKQVYTIKTTVGTKG